MSETGFVVSAHTQLFIYKPNAVHQTLYYMLYFSFRSLNKVLFCGKIWLSLLYMLGSTDFVCDNSGSHKIATVGKLYELLFLKICALSPCLCRQINDYFHSVMTTALNTVFSLLINCLYQEPFLSNTVPRCLSSLVLCLGVRSEFQP
jgi:hypothetical protein